MDTPLHISTKTSNKLKEKHNLTEDEVQSIYKKYYGILLEDIREKNRTYPPTEWFISRTSEGGLLKICIIVREDLGIAFLKTCYIPDKNEVKIFKKKGGII